MSEIQIYGHNDDLIEVDGAVDTELYANYDEPTEFRVGGWTLMAEYDGEWEFTIVDHPPGWQRWTHIPVGESDDHNNYTQVVKVDVPDDVTVEKL